MDVIGLFVAKLIACSQTFNEKMPLRTNKVQTKDKFNNKVNIKVNV